MEILSSAPGIMLHALLFFTPADTLGWHARVFFPPTSFLVPPSRGPVRTQICASSSRWLAELRLSHILFAGKRSATTATGATPQQKRTISYTADNPSVKVPEFTLPSEEEIPYPIRAENEQSDCALPKFSNWFDCLSSMKQWFGLNEENEKAFKSSVGSMRTIVFLKNAFVDQGDLSKTNITSSLHLPRPKRNYEKR